MRPQIQVDVRDASPEGTLENSRCPCTEIPRQPSSTQVLESRGNEANTPLPLCGLKNSNSGILSSPHTKKARRETSRSRLPPKEDGKRTEPPDSDSVHCYFLKFRITCQGLFRLPAADEHQERKQASGGTRQPRFRFAAREIPETEFFKAPIRHHQHFTGILNFSKRPDCMADTSLPSDQ